MKYLHELANTDRQVAAWRRIHAEQHARGLRFGGSQKPWPKCAICRRETEVTPPRPKGKR